MDFFLNKTFIYLENIIQDKSIDVIENFKSNRSRTSTLVRANDFKIIMTAKDRSIGNLAHIEADEREIDQLIEASDLPTPLTNKAKKLLKSLVWKHKRIWRITWRQQARLLKLETIWEEDPQACLQQRNQYLIAQAEKYNLGLLNQLVDLVSIENRIERHVLRIRQYIFAFESEWREKRFCDEKDKLYETLVSKNQNAFARIFTDQLKMINSYQDVLFLTALLAKANALFLPGDKVIFEQKLQEYTDVADALCREAVLKGFFGVVSLLLILPTLLNYERTKNYFSQARAHFRLFQLSTDLAFFARTNKQQENEDNLQVDNTVSIPLLS